MANIVKSILWVVGGIFAMKFGLWLYAGYAILSWVAFEKIEPQFAKSGGSSQP